MKRLFALLAASSLVLALSACGAQDQPAETAAADPGGAWGSHEAGKPWLNLGADGALTGNDGCNSLSGTWTKTGDGADFGAIASTKMYCEGVDSWLGGAATATLQQDTLTVKDAKDQVIGTLQRSK